MRRWRRASPRGRPPEGVTDANLEMWARGEHVAEYSGTEIEPPERAILTAFRTELSGRVLELGSGGGRLTGHLLGIAAEVHGIDISPAMVDRSRRAYPGARFEVGDMRDLSRYRDASLDAVFAACNVMDVFDHEERLATMSEIRRVLRPGGLFAFSSHNRAYAPRLRGPAWVLSRRPRQALRKVTLLPRRLRNHRRLRALERDEPEYAIINDDAHDYSTLMYYVDPQSQARQLDAAGFELLQSLDKDARVLGPGETAPGHVRIHYVSRRSG